ncbi:type II toxin-antitoxin system death-on-curing family toxin [Asticcacaulis sp. SL142]|uniref:type II toxin-antitoxin system death-on-curing family toxin n=1 Tax=Asticcacaulis sp. SL142 TaxID=2995155 RepID=UPI00226C7162|nr:type II toxin-antitoxin system death-on-curing family toxin [Asticcacaulis sp. SL142]WAC47633.1 type II toxin-antitoxin system death-on-curing family toxin [Asticcacaulis sp. SL142]
MSEYRWLREDTLLAIHDEQLAEHGGLSGIRDLKLLQSAVARPQQIMHYGQPDIAELAAAYGYGISRNHPFLDGNKRTAFVSVELFLLLNGFELTADDAVCVLTMLNVASGDITEADFADWIRVHLRQA